MIIGILKEPAGEKRVSALPETVKQLIQMKAEVWVETGAGTTAFAGDSSYAEAGATIHTADEILSNAGLILSIHPPGTQQLNKIRKDTIIMGVYQPLYNRETLEQWAAAGITSFSLDNIPRTSRAQSMDVLSSMANIAGYKAVLLASFQYARYFPMLMTAAGSIAPAKILILGAGVAGLQAIATARRLGAVVEVFDTRPAVKEEVMSLGAKFVEVDGAADASAAGGYAVEQSEEFRQRQKARIAESIAKADVVITTAQIPGRKAPVLITREMLERMRPGSVIIDLASATGGNTEVTKDGETVMFNQVAVTGNSALAVEMPSDASKLYGKNVLNFLKLLIDKEGQLHLNFEDDLVAGTCITHGSAVVNERVKQFFGQAK